jgi:hypothetical protein
MFKYFNKLLYRVRLVAWGYVFELENALYPWKEDPLRYNEEDYYIKVKDDETGESHFVIDWIKGHKEMIERLQDEMIYVKSEIYNLKKNEKNYD